MRLPQIQALRAVAVILVLLYHAQWLPGGYIGVDIFYVISGYLITGLLLREYEESGTISFQNFYIRRVKRLLPSSALVLVTTALFAWLLYPAILRQDLAEDIAAASLYISNYLFASWQMDYQNLGAIPPTVIHYWSLAVEEQFYLLWPLIIYFIYKGRKRFTLGTAIAGITLLSFFFSLYQSSTSPVWAFYSLPTRVWELSIGALLLFIPASMRSHASVLTRNLIWVSLLLIGYGTIRFNETTVFPGTSALYPVVATAIAIFTIHHWSAPASALAKNRFVQWVGDISYPLYLWHWPLLVIPSVYLARELTVLERLLAVLVTFLLSAITHNFLEDPLRKKVMRPKQIVAGTALITVVSLLLPFGIYNSYSEEISLPNGDRTTLSAIEGRPVIYSDGCHLNNGETIPPECIYGDLQSERRIVLFGDSHAAHWFPALRKIADRYGLALYSYTKSACPGPAVRKVEQDNYKNAECEQWRKNVYQRIKEISPEAVIISGLQLYETPSEFRSRIKWWSEGEKSTYNAVQASTNKVIFIADTPHPTRDIPDCLSSGKFERCNDTQPTEPIRTSGYLQIDPNPWLCFPSYNGRCPAIVNNVVAYRDASHISSQMSLALTDRMALALRTVGLPLEKR